MKRLFLSFAFMASFFSLSAQNEVHHSPRLVVGIMVDQMRWDYLIRYNDRYCDGGLRRLMTEGYNCNSLLINYLPAVTAVGHTCAYTGSVPAFTGIIANTMFIDGKWTTSVRDEGVASVGTNCSNGKDCRAGMASPHRLLVTTMTDELRLATNFRSKVISIALKDRAAILPGGHAANGAFWLDQDNNQFVTSSYYMKQLPQWVSDFNRKRLGDKYLAMTTKEKKDTSGYWDLLYPEDTYVQSAGKKERYYSPVGSRLIQSPYGNTLTADMAIASLEGEQLGRNADGIPDFLAISFSATDGIGHQVGPNSPWIEDTYLRLDKDIARILDALDKQVGKGEYAVWLSADHAASHNVEFRHDHNLPAGTWPYYRYTKDMNDSLRLSFGVKEDFIISFESNNVFFNDVKIRECCPSGKTFREYKQEVIDRTISLLTEKKEVAYAFQPSRMPDFLPEPLRTMVRNGYNPKRSGDIQIILEANHTEDYDDGYRKDYDGIVKGTQHSVWSPYDTHIPFIVMGKGIRHAWDNSRHTINDIAPTICSILNIQMPSGCVGQAIDVLGVLPNEK